MINRKNIYGFVQYYELVFKFLLITIGLIIGHILCNAIGPVFKVGSIGFLNIVIFVIGFILLWMILLVSLRHLPMLWTIGVFYLLVMLFIFLLWVIVSSYSPSIVLVIRFILFCLLYANISVLILLLYCFCWEALYNKLYAIIRNTKAAEMLCSAILFVCSLFIAIYSMLMIMTYMIYSTAVNPEYPIFLVTALPLLMYAVFYQLRVHITKKYEYEQKKKEIIKDLKDLLD